MKSNDEYLDELLNSMSEEGTVNDNTSGPMDQAMIDALLAAADSDSTGEEEVANDVLETTMIDAASLAAELEENEEEPESMLAQLMADLQEETTDNVQDNLEEETLMTEEGIDALLNAAKNSVSEPVQEAVSYETPSVSDMEEIEALLGRADSGEVLDENMALLQMLEEAGSFPEEQKQIEDVQEMDLSELDSLLASNNTEGSSEAENNEEILEVEESEKKKSKGMKAFFGKIFAALVEEVPEEEVPEKDSLNLSDENKNILNQLDKEEAKKIKAKEKKEEKERKKQAKKAKKEEKEKKSIEKKADRLIKEKKIKPAIESTAPEKKLPKKKVIVTFVFAFSILAAILVLEFLIPPLLSVNRARSAYDKGEYLEAYKEYYGQKLSEEDEKKFQAATVILRMKSNLDGYNSYLKFDNEIYAIHSLLEAVHIRDDVFAKAQEFDALSQVSGIYNEILELLNGKYGLTEESAIALVKEKSDVTYTKTLQSLAEGKIYEEVISDEVSQDNLLPEEELFFNAD